MHRLIEFGETVVTTSSKDLYYSMDDVFPDDIEELQSDKFDIAFALTAYDGNPEPIEDPKYGRTYARYDSWGYGWRNKNLDTHQCSDEELGLTKDTENSRFFPVHPNYQNDFEFRKKKYQCFDEDIKLKGDYNSERTQRL